jgi:hypothetical protein
MRPSTWLLAVALWGVATGKGFTQSTEEEIARLKKELARLQAENEQLKKELADLKGEGKPNLDLYRPTPGKGRDAGKVIFRWKAWGNTLAKQPVSLYYAEEAGAPWQLIAKDLPKEGTFAWRKPATIPAKVLLSARARDKADEEVVAETNVPALINFPPEMKP